MQFYHALLFYKLFFSKIFRISDLFPPPSEITHSGSSCWPSKDLHAECEEDPDEPVDELHQAHDGEASEEPECATNRREFAHKVDLDVPSDLEQHGTVKGHF